jgi:hypothetical protein
MGNVAYGQSKGAPAPAVVQQGEGAGPIRESAPSSPLVTPQVVGEATNALAPPSINAFAASPVDKFKDRIKAIDTEISQGNSNPAFNKSTAWADAKKRLEKERESLMLTAEQQLRMVTPNPVQTRLGDKVITRDMNPNSPTYGKEIQPAETIGLTAEQALKKTTPNPIQYHVGDEIITKDMNSVYRRCLSVARARTTMTFSAKRAPEALERASSSVSISSSTSCTCDELLSIVTDLVCRNSVSCFVSCFFGSSSIFCCLACIPHKVIFSFCTCPIHFAGKHHTQHSIL